MLFLFEVHVRPGYSVEQYAEAWVRASRHLQQAPGAQGTRLHRSLDRPDVLLAIARWDSKAARDAMEQQRPDAARRIIEREAAFVDVRVIGEFADPEWVVLPGDDPASSG